MKQYFLQKAQHARPDLITSGWEWSIKLDGMRAFWDGGVSRGRVDAPWAPGVLATGLWSNNGKPLYPPDWWLDEMPNFVADGELWAGVGNAQIVSSVCRKKTPHPGWSAIHFMHHTPLSIEDFLYPRNVQEKFFNGYIGPEFQDYFYIPTQQKEQPGSVFLDVDWTPLTSSNPWTEANEILDSLVSDGHEGLMLRPANGRIMVHDRSWQLLKLKPFREADVVVIGVKSGEATDKGSRLLGRVGSLKCKYKNNIFYVGGFTDSQRELMSLNGEDAYTYACDHPGEDMPSYIQSASFPNGTLITIKYRELTTYREVPKDPRFFRKHIG